MNDALIEFWDPVFLHHRITAYKPHPALLVHIHLLTTTRAGNPTSSKLDNWIKLNILSDYS